MGQWRHILSWEMPVVDVNSGGHIFDVRRVIAYLPPSLVQKYHFRPSKDNMWVKFKVIGDRTTFDYATFYNDLREVGLTTNADFYKDGNIWAWFTTINPPHGKTKYNLLTKEFE